MKKITETTKEAAENEIAAQGIPDKSATGLDKEMSEEVFNKAKHAIDVALKPISKKVIEIFIGGDALVTHAWGAKALRQMLEQQQMTKEEKKLAKDRREKKDPRSDYMEARYIRQRPDGSTFDAFPTNGIKKALVEAGYMLGIPRNAIKRGVRIIGDFAEIEHDAKEPAMREDCVRVGPFNNRTADLRYRPEYRNWRMKLKIEFRADMINAEQLANLLENAGFSIGIGEWRPDRDGQFGTFEVLREQSVKKVA